MGDIKQSSVRIFDSEVDTVHQRLPLRRDAASVASLDGRSKGGNPKPYSQGLEQHGVFSM